MARAYTVATAALALGTSSKWLDNTLSHYPVMGIVQQKQGVARRLTIEALLTLAVTLALTQEVGSTVVEAIAMAEKLIAGGGRFKSQRGLRIELDLQEFRDHLLFQLEQAVEIAPLPRRGRPPKNTTGRLD